MEEKKRKNRRAKTKEEIKAEKMKKSKKNNIKDKKNQDIREIVEDNIFEPNIDIMQNKQQSTKKENNTNKKTKKKKMKTWKKVLLVILLIIMVLAGWFIYKVNRNGGGLTGILATAVGHDENTKKNLAELRVLLLGASTDIDVVLTDTIMVASYNPNTQKANLLSIPRDTYTGKIPSTATADMKINAIYTRNKNPKDVLNVVNEITGMNIKYYALIKNEALVELVDAIGGVKFNVPIDMKYHDKKQKLYIDLKAGEQVLNGKQAEGVLRWRHSNRNAYGTMTTYPSEYGSDDYGRMRTQRDFILATLKQTLKPGNIFKLGEILEIANKNITTNLEISYLKDYIPYAVEFNTDDLQTATLPGEFPDYSKTNGLSIFVANQEETAKMVKEMFGSAKQNKKSETTNSENTTTETSTSKKNKVNKKIKVELLNGTGKTSTKKMNKAKKILEEAGYKITSTGTSMSLSKTIITNKKDVNEATLKDLKSILGTGNISTNKISYSLVDVTIVIGKDF